jgi:hemolysin activation/secretion protein
VRGYREGEAVGDSGFFATVELRSPGLLHPKTGVKQDWRVYLFADGGWLKVIDELPGQKNHYDFLSYGLGSRVQLTDHFTGTINTCWPMLTVGETRPETLRLLFQGILNY